MRDVPFRLEDIVNTQTEVRRKEKAMKQALMRTKRTLAFLLTLAMVLTSVPAYAYEMPGAGNGTPDEGLTEEITEEATEGAEETGISPDLLKLADARAKLPILGQIQSLNVSVAAAVFMYEVLRQRG